MYRNRLARFAPFAPILGAGLMMVACQNPSDKQRQADQTQSSANQQKAEAQQRSEQKAGEAQRQAQEQANKAQGAMSQEVADTRNRVQRALADNNAKISEMQTAAGRATGPRKSEDDRLLKDATTQRDILNNDLNALNNVTPADWPGMKTKIETDLDAFDSSVKAASRRIKTAVAPPSAPRSNVPGTPRPAHRGTTRPSNP